jgi:hypothetical protein
MQERYFCPFWRQNRCSPSRTCRRKRYRNRVRRRKGRRLRQPLRPRPTESAASSSRSPIFGPGSPRATLPQEGAAGDAGQGVGNAAGLTARIDAIETQMGALTSQLELLTQQLGALETRLGGSGGSPQQLAPPQAEEPETPVAPPPSGDDPLPELPGRQGALQTSPPQLTAEVPRQE